MIFEQIPIGGDRNFSYLIGDETTKSGAIVDPAYHQEHIMSRVAHHGLHIRYILCTHSDYDHVGGNDVMKEKIKGVLVIGHQSIGNIADEFVDDKDEIRIGSLIITTIYTPGHTCDSICFYVKNKIITGDTLFVGKIGGTRNRQAAEYQYKSLHNQLMTLPEDTVVYPGHDVGTSPTSTIGREKQTNPFLLQKTFEDFHYLKEHWREYKKSNNIR